MSLKSSQFENKIEVIKRPTNEYVLMVDHEIIDFGETADNGSLVVLGSNFIRLEYNGEVLAESRGVYFEIIFSLKEQGSLIKVIMMPDGDTYPILNVCRVVTEEEYNALKEDKEGVEESSASIENPENDDSSESLVNKVENILKDFPEESEVEKSVSDLESKLPPDIYDEMLTVINDASDSISSIYSDLVLNAVDEKASREIFDKLNVTFDSISKLRSHVFDLKFSSENLEKDLDN